DLGFRGGALERRHPNACAPACVHGNEVQDCDGPVGGSVLEPELSASCFATRTQRDRAARAGVELVHPSLQHVHRVLLQTRLSHMLSFMSLISGAPDSRGACPRAPLRATARMAVLRYPAR